MHGPVQHGGQGTIKGKTLKGRGLLTAPPSFWWGLSPARAKLRSQQAAAWWWLPYLRWAYLCQTHSPAHFPAWKLTVSSRLLAWEAMAA